MRVVVTGYAVGFRKKQKKKSEGHYYQLDLMQFGNEEVASQIQSLIIYNEELAKFLDKSFEDGKIKVLSCTVDLIENAKNDVVWLVRSIETFGNVSNITNITISRNLITKLKEKILSESLGISINELIERLVKDFLESDKNEKVNIHNFSSDDTK